MNLYCETFVMKKRMLMHFPAQKRISWADKTKQNYSELSLKGGRERQKLLEKKENRKKITYFAV
jgi:hypothetical protein